MNDLTEVGIVAKNSVSTQTIERLRSLANLAEETFSRIDKKLEIYCINEPTVNCNKESANPRSPYPEYFSDMRNIMDMIEQRLKDINDKLHICEL